MADKLFEFFHWNLIDCPYCKRSIALSIERKIQTAKVEWIDGKPIPTIELPGSARTGIKTNDR